MPRVYKRKSETPHVSENVLKVAVAEVENGMSLREATYSAGISKSALHRCIKKKCQYPAANLQPNYQHSMIFSVAQEQTLSTYLKSCSDMLYGLTPVQVRALAFEMAQANKIKCPLRWIDEYYAI